MLARAALMANGCNVMPVPTDTDGMDIEAARRKFPTPRMIFVSPARQYPLGATLSVERRAALVEFSHVTGAWILEDDYDCDFASGNSNRFAISVPSAVAGRAGSLRILAKGVAQSV